MLPIVTPLSAMVPLSEPHTTDNDVIALNLTIAVQNLYNGSKLQALKLEILNEITYSATIVT